MADSTLRLSPSSRCESRSVTGIAPYVIVIVLATLVFRSFHFGNPDVDFDEPFYLLVGDRMLHGAIPYVDIWDRKPIGLFLIYAAIRLLGGEGFTQYLVVAALFAGATASMIWLIASRWISRAAALLPACVYVLWQEPYAGSGGQSAIFYNLLTVVCFWLLLKAKDHGNSAIAARSGLIAMALMGIELQIKYVVLPEGIFFGLAFLALQWQDRPDWRRLVGWASIYVIIALTPTLLAIGFYAAIGHANDFLFANFQSLYARGHLERWYMFRNMVWIYVVAMPLLGAVVFGLSRLALAQGQGRSDFPWLVAWCCSAFVGFMMIGNFYHYYFMPVLLVLALASAGNLTERRWGLFIYAGLLLWPVAIGLAPSPQDDRLRIASIHRLTDAIAPHVNARHCLYVFDGPTALYMTTHSCLLTRFAYPDHLSNGVESAALGVNAQAELDRVLARQPGAIVTAAPKLVPALNLTNVHELEKTLARDYYLAATDRHAWRTVKVWVRRDEPGASPPPPPRHVELYPPIASWQ
jgi:hypothetical protein